MRKRKIDEQRIYRLVSSIEQIDKEIFNSVMSKYQTKEEIPVEVLEALARVNESVKAFLTATLDLLKEINRRKAINDN